MKKVLASTLMTTLLCSTTAFAQQDTPPPARSGRSGTILKWTLIGAAAGFGTGFLLGFHAYDDATYAERKIMRSGLLGAAIGGGGGALLGSIRARYNSIDAYSRPLFPSAYRAPHADRPLAGVRIQPPSSAAPDLSSVAQDFSPARRAITNMTRAHGFDTGDSRR